jgi:anti-sigma factor (TIGR02949 family)
MNSILARIASSGCASVRSRLAEYLDGRLTGREMQRIAKHLEGCGKCAAEFEAEQHLLRALSSLGAVSGPSRQPDDLLLRIRVAISQERAQRRRSRLDDWRLAWHNSIGPFLLKASTGFASAVLLLGTVSVLVGMFAHPEPASAQDEPLGMATAPKFLYQSGAIPDVENIGTTEDGPIVVEAYVNGQGRVYDYRIVSGPTDPQTRSQVVNLLLCSVFEPARFFGQPVRGLAVLSFSGVSVHS